ncbi:MAG: 30S ribosomal protein S4 [Omnitrophica bacterium RIFCSPHIGHO2_02_FULL_46_11]|nr:MAG: 30S ribosomal protein S4 [Omnitrophica bacterium RIFCSPLOWO2_01_FULL_45_10b]OGW86517.1 MAG: 30S ribosomal protein S4 [Omnitrophica bacterium RIFCSPHIGHO2_02_FULL_46_11]
MARRTGAVCRLCRREGIKLFLKGIRCTGDKCAIERRNTPPGMHKRSRGKLSDYGLQLREKQKAKKIYGMLERQFRSFFERASKKRGVTGETLIQLLERRLDSVVYRLLFVPSRAEARQLVTHGSVLVNGRTVNIPSFQVRIGDVIQLHARETLRKRVQGNLEMLKDRPISDWLDLNRGTLEAKVVRLPGKADAGLPVEESQIVELYSK